MSNRFFAKGRANFAGAGNLTSDTLQGTLVDLTVTDVAIKAISAITSATPMVVTSNSHGFSNGDIVVIGGVLGMTAANGTWVVASVATNTFALTTFGDGATALNSTFNSAYTSGGYAVNLTLASANTDVDAGILPSGTPQTQALTTVTVTNGVFDADDPTFTGIAGTVHAMIIRDSTTSTPIYFMDGKTQVMVMADAASSATTLWVRPLEGAIPSGAVLVFSNGVSATLSSGATAGARSLAVNALASAIAAGHTADAGTTNNGFGPTLAGNNFTVNFDNGANRIAAI